MDSRRLLLQLEPIGSPLMSESSKSDDDGNTNILESNFDTNMVIILAALLLALICTLALNSVLRRALRCSTSNNSPSSETDQESSLGNKTTSGIKKKALDKIPVVVYGSSGGQRIINPTSSSIGATECPICLGEFVVGEKLRVLPKCNHGFHVVCIDTWLNSHASCPNCRHSLLQS